jgi:prepilin-type N-terminal cleavage/methylation domain-containing protein
VRRAADRLGGDEKGFSLIELLVGMTLFVVILSAVLLTYNTLEANSKVANDRNDSQERARHELDLLSKELRNLASPTPEQPQAVDKATSYDIVFQTVDPTAPPSGTLNTANVRRVRYCLDSSNPANEVLWTQWQTWTTVGAPSSPSTVSCPDGAWGAANRRQVTTNVTNRISGQDRPLFSFNTSVATDVNSIHTDLYIDLTPGANPSETHLTTGVFLRNQNRKPTAAFTATPGPSGRLVVLNGAGSEDPEGSPLTYRWYDVTGTGTPNDSTNKIGDGITCNCVAKASGARSIVLRVFDAANLSGDSAPQNVSVAP